MGKKILQYLGSITAFFVPLFAYAEPGAAQPGISTIFVILNSAGTRIVGQGGTRFAREVVADPTSAIIGGLLGIVFGFISLILLVLLIYGGFLWMTARGEEDQVDKAKQIITRAIIGLVIVIGAYAISYYLLFIFTEIVTQRPVNVGGELQ